MLDNLNAPKENLSLEEKEIKVFTKKFWAENELIDFETDDGVIDADKAFFCANVIRFCFQQKNKKKMTLVLFEEYIKALKLYIKDKINMSWDGKGKLKVTRKVEKQNENISQELTKE
mgnify:CR=1 FL=1